MSDTKNVLVYPAGTEIAFEIHEALKYSKFVKLFGANGEECHADFVFKNCFYNLPYANDDNFIDAINDIVDKYNIDYIYPAHDDALLVFSNNREKVHCEIIASDKKTIDICRSKNKTYDFLSGSSYLPVNYKNINEIPSYPVFIKPSVGQGSKGAMKINDQAHLEEALSSEVEYTISEFLPGAEYTVDCFTDIHGKLRFVNPRTRERIRAGISVRSRNIAFNQDIQNMAEDINSRLSFNGAWFFQIKENKNGQFRLMEIAPRIAGTMGFTRNLGVNMPLLTLYNFCGYDVDIINNANNSLVDRAFISRFKTDISYDTVYVDFDDSLIVKNLVNTQLIMFLYQAKNAGKSIVLLTRHSTDIYEDLAKYCISEKLFDEIIHLKVAEDNKTDYIKPNSIFIDDSFAERKRVHDKCHIPVFDLDMIESLLDWKA